MFIVKRHLPAFYSEKLLHGALYALLFFIPLSSSLKSIMLVVSVILLLLQHGNRQSVQWIMRQSWVWWSLALVALVVLSCAWSPAPWNEQGFVVEKYTKLLWMPFLVLGFSDTKTRTIGLHVFLASMLVTVLCAFAIALGWMHSILPAGSVFRNHIITGHMLAFACYLSGYYAIKVPKWRWIYVALLLIMSYEILFISQGRTGYVVYGIDMLVLIIQFFKRWQLLLAVGLLALLGLFAFHTSTIMQVRVAKVYEDVAGIKQGNASTSLGFRMQFQQFAYALFKQHPVVGNGSGAITYYFDTRNPIADWGKQLREPHNQYWLIAAEYGVVGLFIYIGWLLALLLNILRLQQMKFAAIALLIPFVVGSFTDSLLFYSGCGYFFLVNMALCFGEQCRVAKAKRAHPHSKGSF